MFMEIIKKVLIHITMLLAIIVVMLCFSEKTVSAKPIISNKKISVYCGLKKKLRVYNNKHKKVKWSTTNSKIAKVTKNGNVKALKVGKATVIAKVGKKKLKCKVKVLPIVTTDKKSGKCTLRGQGDIQIYTAFGISAKLQKKVISGIKINIKNPEILQYTGDDAYYAKQFPGFKRACFFCKKSGTTYVTITNSFNGEKKTLKVKVLAPNIVLPQPTTVSYHSYSKALINNVEIIDTTSDNDSSYYTSLRINGKKTYDRDGTFGTSGIHFLLILYDENGKIIETRHVYSSATLIVGQEFSERVGIGSTLLWNTAYRIEIQDYS